MLFAAELVHLLLLAGAILGCVTILRAGLAESRGELERSRSAARRGGFVMAGFTLATLISGSAVLALLPRASGDRLSGPTPAGTVLVSLAILLPVLSGLIGLLAGLSGKPRPAGYVAAAGCAAGIFFFLAVLLR